MNKQLFRTITGRTLDLSSLTAEESAFLAAVQSKYKGQLEWSEFASWWFQAFRRSSLPDDSVLYRLCQDLEARLGMAQGKVAVPDYRDFLADLIEERYGSRYRFCKETGTDPGHLSRVLAGRSELSLKALSRILVKLRASLIIQPDEDLVERSRPEEALKELVKAS